MFQFLGFLEQNNSPIGPPIAITLGAIPGALSRYYITIWLAQWLGTDFPFGTFFINLSGSLLMGFIATLVIEQVIPSENLQLLITSGFLGSYTTFSTYTLDTLILLRSGSKISSLFYWLGSLVLGGVFLEIGVILGRLVAK